MTLDFHLLPNCQITSSFISDILDSSSAAFIKFVMVVRLTERSIIERVEQEEKKREIITIKMNIELPNVF